jgi:hypothetical protein
LYWFQTAYIRDKTALFVVYAWMVVSLADAMSEPFPTRAKVVSNHPGTSSGAAMQLRDRRKVAIGQLPALQNDTCTGQKAQKRAEMEAGNDSLQTV